MKGKKSVKKGIYLLILGMGFSLFWCGFWIGKEERKGKEWIEDGVLPQNRNWKKIREGERFSIFMEEKKEEFLEEHLYGQWRFLERVAKDRNKDYALSENGEKELKKMVILEYQKEWVRHPLKEGQTSFSNPKDMWIFGLYGGFSWGKLPTYTMTEMGSNQISLRNLKEEKKPYQVRVFDIGAENFMHVTYSFRTLQGGSEYLNYQEEYFGSNIYIDPNDTENIYVEFCGLWRMVRVVEK